MTKRPIWMISAVLYILAVLGANLTATLFLPFEIAPGSGVLVSVGTLVFGITFTQRDRMHAMGRPFVYRIILLSAVLNLLMLTSLRYVWGAPVLALLEARGWEWLSGGTEVLMENGWQVFLASFLAIVVAEAADTEIFHHYRDKAWIFRVTRSNAVSVPVDSVLFNLIAFAGSAFFPAAVLVKVIIGEILAKFAVGLVYALVIPKPRTRSEA